MSDHTITIDPGGANETVLNPADIEALDFVKTHTGVGDWQADVTWNPSLDDRLGDEIHIEDGSTFLFRGFLQSADSAESAGQASTRIGGLGIAHDLERNGNEITYRNGLVHNAIEDYWDFEAPVGFQPQMTDQTADETLSSFTSQQEADTDAEFTDITSIADTEPVEVRNSNIELLQTCFFTEAESFSNESDSRGTIGSEDDDFSRQSGRALQNLNALIEWEFTNEYTIPEDAFEVAIRMKDGTGQSLGGLPGIEYRVILDGGRAEIVDSHPTQTNVVLGWKEVGDGFYSNTEGWTGGDIPPGTHTVQAKVTDASPDGGDDPTAFFDVVAPYDNRFGYTFDNSIDANNDLAGPELFPLAYQVEFNRAATTWTITEGQITSSWNDTSNEQQLRMRLPPTGTYQPVTPPTSSSGDGDNTETVSVDFTTASGNIGVLLGSAIQGRVQFSRFGSRTGTSPSSGFNGQILQSWDLQIKGDDRPVITESTYEGSDLEILQQLHNEGRMRFTIEHDTGASWFAYSYPDGGQVQSQPSWTKISTTKHTDIEDMYNEVTVRGSRDDDGNRFTITVEDSTSISNFGREHWDEKNPELQSQTEVERVARQILKRKVKQSNVTAEREIVSLDLDAGFAYPIDLPDGTTENVASEEVEYRISDGNIVGRVRFNIMAKRLESRLSRNETGLRSTKLAF